MLQSPIRALVFSNGPINDGPAVQDALRAAPQSIIIAADGGSRVALACGLTPHEIVGDMDSLTAEEIDTLKAQGAILHRHKAAKEETDLELALLVAVARQATWIRLIGAVGGRMDQSLGNISLLALRELAGRDVRIVSHNQQLWLIGPGMHTISGAPGDTISLIPWGGSAVSVRTENLLYPLRDETLFLGPARGMSNVMQTDTAGVRLASGMLLVVHTPGRA